MLTRKYYKLIARVIKMSTSKTSNKMLPVINKTLLVSELCNELHNDNSYFDKNKFIDACNQSTTHHNTHNNTPKKSPRIRGLFLCSIHYINLTIDYKRLKNVTKLQPPRGSASGGVRIKKQAHPFQVYF